MTTTTHVDAAEVVAELTRLGLRATQCGDPDTIVWNGGEGPTCGPDPKSLIVDLTHDRTTDVESMVVAWYPEWGWTFYDVCTPSLGGDQTCHLGEADGADPASVAARIRAICDGSVDEFRPVREATS